MRRAILLLFFLLAVDLPGYSDRGNLLVTMRKIGHEVLLASGDSTSLVLPVEQVDDGTFLIRFQRPFTFKPASLVELINRQLRENSGSLDYLVEVKEATRNTVVYSYEVHPPLNRKTIACLTRIPPQGAYRIQIRFNQPSVQPASNHRVVQLTWLLLPVLLIGIGWVFVNRNAPTPPPVEEVAPLNWLRLGPLTFCRDKQILRLGDERIELSTKESKLLNVFANAPNVVIDRSQLMKLVWEDEGVFVGRSLDVFISRLRKKLQPASTVRIVTSHGRGYKLEIDSPGGSV